MMKKMSNATLIGIVVIAGILLGSATSIMAISPAQVAVYNKWSTIEPCRYVVFTDGTTYYAKNCNTGNIDYSGTSGSTVIQSTVDAVAADSGGKIALRQGVYTLTSTLVLPKDSGITFEGEAVTKQFSGYKGAAVLKAGATMTNLISISGSSFADSNDDLSHSHRFENIIIDGNDQVTNNIYAFNTDTVTVQDARLINSITGIRTAYNGTDPPSAGSAPGALTVDNTIIENGANGYGIVLHFQTQVWITDSWFTGAASGKHILVNATTKVRISGNEFNTAASAIMLDDTTSKATQDIIITGNEFVVGGSNKAIENSLAHASSYNIRHTNSGNVYQTGVLIDALPRDFYGTATISSGSTSITVTHNQGISFPLGCIQVTPTNNATNAVGHMWVTSAGTNNFAINVAKAPGASTATFAWAIIC